MGGKWNECTCWVGWKRSYGWAFDRRVDPYPQATAQSQHIKRSFAGSHSTFSRKQLNGPMKQVRENHSKTAWTESIGEAYSCSLRFGDTCPNPLHIKNAGDVGTKPRNDSQQWTSLSYLSTFKLKKVVTQEHLGRYKYITETTERRLNRIVRLSWVVRRCLEFMGESETLQEKLQVSRFQVLISEVHMQRLAPKYHKRKDSWS